MLSSHNKIKVLIADDHQLFLLGLSQIFNIHKDIELVGAARDGAELLKMTERLRPDVILTDVQMPVMNGIEATFKIKEMFPRTEVIGFSFFADFEMITSMINAGAKGYLEKSVVPDEVTKAIRTVYQGRTYFCKTSRAVLREQLKR
jgi:DNA-binding NarL/FixJ family response regulator